MKKLLIAAAMLIASTGIFAQAQLKNVGRKEGHHQESYR